MGTKFSEKKLKIDFDLIKNDYNGVIFNRSALSF